MDDRLVLCPVCKGWGVKQLPVKKEYIPCDYCNSESSQLITSDYYIIWDIPSYVEFKIRKINKIKRIIYISIITFMILIGLLLLLPLLNGI